MPLGAMSLESTNPDLLRVKASREPVGANRLPTVLVVDERSHGAAGAGRCDLESAGYRVALRRRWRRGPETLSTGSSRILVVFFDVMLREA